MVRDCLNDYSIKLCQRDMAQKSSGVEIFACKVGATQIKSVFAQCHTLGASNAAIFQVLAKHYGPTDRFLLDTGHHLAIIQYSTTII